MGVAVMGQAAVRTPWRCATGRRRAMAEATRRRPTATRQLLPGPAPEPALAWVRAQWPAPPPDSPKQTETETPARSGCDRARTLHEIGRDRARARQQAGPQPKPAMQRPVRPVEAVIAASALAALPPAHRHHRSAASHRRSRLRASPAQVAAGEAARLPDHPRRRSSHRHPRQDAPGKTCGDRRRAPHRSPHNHRRVANSGSAGADLAARTICTNSARWP